MKPLSFCIQPMKLLRFLKQHVWFSVCLAFLLSVLFLLLLPFAMVQRRPDLEGVRAVGDWRAVQEGQAGLLWDLTAKTGDRTAAHQVFPAMLDAIERADRFVVADFFLWNPWTGSLPAPGPELALPLAEALMARKRALPDLPVLVITDPINHVYGGEAPEYFKRMEAAGVVLVHTDLGRLRDSNPLYSFYANLLPALSAKGVPNPDQALHRPRLPNPFEKDGPPASIAQYLRLLHFKANHRKVLVTGHRDGTLELIAGSLNPADGSAAHFNVAVKVSGALAMDAAVSELGVASWSGCGEERVALCVARIREMLNSPVSAEPSPEREAAGHARWLSEGAIRDALVEAFRNAGPGDAFDIALFYLSDRAVIRAMKHAVKEGAELRLLLDANRDAFGREKNGIPNRVVAGELLRVRGKGRVEVRWADTHGEQFHCKALGLRPRAGAESMLLLGSANWTRRNLEDFNLEAAVQLRGLDALSASYHEVFEQLWRNGSLPYEVWEERGMGAWVKAWLYRFQEASGLCTF
jgi:hypothetical protein